MVFRRLFLFVASFLLVSNVAFAQDGQFESAISYRGQTVSVSGTLGSLRLKEDCDQSKSAPAELFLCHTLDGVRYEDADVPLLSLTFYDTSLLSRNATDDRLKRFESGLGIFRKTLEGDIALAAYGAHSGDSLTQLQAVPIMTRQSTTVALVEPRFLKAQDENTGIAYIAADQENSGYRIFMDYVFQIPNTTILGVYSMPVVQADGTGTGSFAAFIKGKVTATNTMERGLQLEDALQAYATVNLVSSSSFSSIHNAVQNMISSVKTTPFIDVFPSTPFAEAILAIRSRNIIQGYSDGTFKPNAAVNRAEFMKILVEASGAKNLDRFVSQCFPDVDTTQWYAKYVCYGKEKGIIAGYSDGSFRPTATINLVEGLKIMFNTYNINVETSSGEWYQPYMDEARRRGMLVLLSAQVGDTLSRGEMAELIYRLLNS